MTASDDPVRLRASSDGDRRRARRALARRRVIRRRRRVAGFMLVTGAALIALLISSVTGGSSATRPGSAANARSAPAVRTNSASATAPLRTGAPSPGSLPQTDAFPSQSSARFRSLMASLWSGIVHDSRTEALAAFFPKDAYVRLKAIASPSSDWTERLVHDYGLDITAAHALLGANAGQARLIAVNAPSGYAHWVPPGACYNSIGYYELPNARVLYREEGQTRSLGIASMISWRGVWYVVHLGAVSRSADEGVVDEPASGPGTSADSGTC